MDDEIIEFNEIHVPHRIVKIRGNGACLFSSLSYLVHGNVSMAAQIRGDIVRHVSNNWQRIKPFTQNRSGTPYTTKCRYLTEMSRPYTYGVTYEIKAAGEIFPYEFQVFQGGILFATFGEAIQGVKRIQFTGDFKEGHFEVLRPFAKLTNPDNVQLTNPDNVQQSPTTSEPTECEPNFVQHRIPAPTHSLH